MLTAEVWEEIRRLHFAQGVGIREIARRIGVSRDTVRRALRSDEPPRYRRTSRGSPLDELEPQIKEVLDAHPEFSSTQVARRVGWKGSGSAMRARIRRIKASARDDSP